MDIAVIIGATIQLDLGLRFEGTSFKTVTLYYRRYTIGGNVVSIMATRNWILAWPKIKFTAREEPANIAW